MTLDIRQSLVIGIPFAYVTGIIVLLQSLYSGMFSIVDVVTFTRVASGIVTTGGLFEGGTYSNGFGYPAIVSVVSMLSGVSVSTLQLYIVPFGLLFTVVAATVLFRGMFDSVTAAFGTLLLFSHPFILFSGYRSTHEKLTYLFVLLTIFALYQTFTTGSDRSRMRYILVGYLVLLGVVTQNVFFASALIVAIGTSLVATEGVGIAYGRRLRTRRLAYTVATSFVILLVVAFFLYPPARRLLISAGSAFGSVAALILGNAPSGTGGQTYQSALTGWGNFQTWLLLTSFYWVVFPVAGATWLVKLKELIFGDGLDNISVSLIFVMALFASFSLQLVGSVIVDQAGVFFGTNTQIRILPLVGILAVILATIGVRDLFQGLRDGDVRLLPSNRQPIAMQSLAIAVVVLLVVFSGAGILKASSNPIVSDNWIFTTDDEQDAMEWIETEATNQQIWTGYNERVTAGYAIRHPERPTRNNHEIFGVDVGIHYVLASDTLSALAQDAGLPLPPHDDASLVYSNGDARLYWFDGFRPMHEFNRALGVST